MTEPGRVSPDLPSPMARLGCRQLPGQTGTEWQKPGTGPGRVWGVWGLKRCAKAVEVTPQAATMAARVMRRWARAQGVTHKVTVRRSPGGAIRSAYPEVIGLAGVMLMDSHKLRRRKVRRRARRMARGRGWISLNDGPAFALEVARYLEMRGYD